MLKKNENNVIIYVVKSVDSKRFKMIDEKFICENCNREVKPLEYSARDHCNHCLYSKHVDIFPGDRACDCHGLLEPIALEKFKDSYKIVYRCLKCQKLHKNIVAKDDDFDEMLKLMQNPASY